MITSAISDSEATQIILDEFCSQTGLADVEHEIRQGSTRSVLVLRMANPTERFFSVLQNVLSKLDDQPQTVTIERRTAKNRLDSPEARYFLRTLAESLNVSRNTFKDDFFARYTNSGSNAETQITAAANHVVFGRRGAGKSSLLLYAMRTRERRNLPSAWIDMQVFEKRTDYALVLDVIREMLQQTTVPPTKTIDRASALSEVDRLRKSAEAGDEQIRQLLPQVRSVISSSSVIAKDTFVFLDDFHVLDISMQPKLLGYLYSIIRGTSTFLKLSSIETLTRTWDAKTHTGLQIPHDAQVIRLDYNLTMPDKAYSHIEGILDAHAVYCGLPSVKYLCTSPDVISRLVWVSAGVPRDALNLFAQAMTKGVTEGRGQVSVTNINVAASEMVSQKMRDLETDLHAQSDEESLTETLEKVKTFCIKDNRKNAFLLEIKNDNQLYQQVLKLVDLRLIHIISEGITVNEAGRKYRALLLDFGFYTGIRAARSVEQFNKTTGRIAYKELRTLPILES